MEKGLINRTIYEPFYVFLMRFMQIRLLSVRVIILSKTVQIKHFTRHSLIIATWLFLPLSRFSRLTTEMGTSIVWITNGHSRVISCLPAQEMLDIFHLNTSQRASIRTWWESNCPRRQIICVCLVDMFVYSLQPESYFQSFSKRVEPKEHS